MIDNNPLLQSSIIVDPIEEAVGYLHQLSLDQYIPVAKRGLHVFAPYHNLTHELLVVYHAVNAYRHYHCSEPHQTKLSELRLLALAALFHDHNHSAGTTKDTANIDRALKCVNNLSNISQEDLLTINTLIQKTEFTDGKFPYSPMNFIQKCLRDADLCMIYTNEGRRLLMELPREVDGGFSLYRRSKKEIKEWLTKNQEFLESCEMFTEYGQLMKEFHLARACQDFEDLVNYAVGANYVAGHSNWINNEKL